MRKHLEESFNPGKLSVFSYPGILDSFLNPLLKMNWYVHNFTELDHEDFTVSYIVRYAKKAPLAEWQILDYGKKSGSGEYIVTFSYKERQQPEVEWTVPVGKFISLLIQHIPPKHFRKVRYYGALATRIKPLFKRILTKFFRNS